MNIYERNRKEQESIKQLTLKQLFRKCIKSWDWYVEYLEYDSSNTMCQAKQAYRKKFNTTISCVFCTFVLGDGYGCMNCPGVQVDPDFRCGNIEYSYHSKPKLFLKKIKELYQILLKQDG